MLNPPSWNFILGTIIALASACLSSLGLNLQAAALLSKTSENIILFPDHQHLSPDDLLYNDQLLESPASESDCLIPPPTPFRLYISNLWTSSQWYVGFCLYTLCQVFGSVVALAFISPMVFAPLGSLGLIFNILFSSIFLGTIISTYDWIGTILIVAGCAVVSTFGSNISDSPKSIDALIILFTKPAFIAYTSVQVFIEFSLLFAIKYLEFLVQRQNLLVFSNTPTRMNSRLGTRRSFSMDASQRPPLRNSTSRHSITIKTTINEEATGIENEVMIRASSTSSINRIREDYEQRFRNEREQQMHEDDEHRLRIDIDPFPSESEQRVPLIRTNTATSVIRTVTPLNVSGLIGILYAILGGIVASDTLLLTKSGVDVLLISIIDSKNQFHGVFSLIIVSLLIITAFSQVYSLNSALKYELPVLVLPIFYTFFTCLSLTNTMVYLDAFGSSNLQDLVFLSLGIGLIVVGVWVLTKSQPETKIDLELPVE